MNIKDIRELVAGAKYRRAISALKAIAQNTDFYDNVIALSARYEAIEDESLSGTLSNENEAKQKAAIAKDILRIIGKMEKELNTNNKPELGSNNNPGISVSGNSNTVYSGIHNSTINNGSNKPENKDNPPDKKKILFIYSTPSGKMMLNFGHEIKRIKEALKTSNYRDRNKFEFVVEEAVEADKLFRLLRNQKADFIHIALHGSKRKGLLFENSFGQEYAISAEDMKDTFELLTMRHKTHCVILNACHSEDEAAAVSVFTGYAIGNRESMPDEAAIVFTRAFYEMIFDGEDVEYAFKVAVMALKRLRMQPEEGVEIHDIPVLFINGKKQ